MLHTQRVPDMSKLNDNGGARADQGCTLTESAPMLNGRTALVVESEIIIALGIQEVLQSLGAGKVVLARNPADANERLPDWQTTALAIVEIEADKLGLIEFARQLSQSGIAVIGLSTDSVQAQGVPELPDTPILLKPLPDADLAQAIRVRLGQNP